MKIINSLSVLLLLAISIISCGNSSNNDDDDSSSQEENSKSLFSRWIIQTPDPDEIDALDFRGYSFGEQSDFFLSLADGSAICRCSILFTGNESSGRISLNSCTNIPVDCSSLENNDVPYTYTKANSELEICSTASSCTIYE